MGWAWSRNFLFRTLGSSLGGSRVKNETVRTLGLSVASPLKSSTSFGFIDRGFPPMSFCRSTKALQRTLDKTVSTPAPAPHPPRPPAARCYPSDGHWALGLLSLSIRWGMSGLSSTSRCYNLVQVKDTFTNVLLSLHTGCSGGFLFFHLSRCTSASVWLCPCLFSVLIILLPFVVVFFSLLWCPVMQKNNNGTELPGKSPDCYSSEIFNICKHFCLFDTGLFPQPNTLLNDQSHLLCQQRAKNYNNSTCLNKWRQWLSVQSGIARFTTTILKWKREHHSEVWHATSLEICVNAAC